MKISAIRLTLFAFISAIERDIRIFIHSDIYSSIGESIFDFDSELKERLKDRCSKDVGLEDIEFNVLDLIEYLDFSDLSKIINKYIQLFSREAQINLKSVAQILENLSPIRNRVMHSRPLLTNDFPELYDKVEEILKKGTIKWGSINKTIEMLKEDPSFVFNLTIPDYEQKLSTSIPHNLPMPEFDETGLIGREEEEKEIKQLILGYHHVITLIGEGGIGKTALVVKCLFDLLDYNKGKFDAIVWVTLKTKVLTVSGIKNIDDAIQDTTGLFSKINSELSGQKKKDINSTLDEIINYTKEFSILLVIDNLETINDPIIRNFLSNIGGTSKVIITSRVGIGELEIRKNIMGLREKCAIQLLNLFAKLRDAKNILTLKDSIKKEICSKLNYNPLAIRWFVTSVAQGAMPNRLLKHSGDLHEFCFSNVYTRLCKESKLVLDVLLILNRSCSESEIAYLCDLDMVSYKKSLNELFLTSIVKIENKIDKNDKLSNLFSLNDFAKEYLNKFHRPSSDMFVEINKRKNALVAAKQEMDTHASHSPYSPRCIVFDNIDEKISASFLIRALKTLSELSLDKDVKKKVVFENIEKAKELCPQYAENYRVSAFAKATFEDYYGANLDYEQALELEPDSLSANFFYAGFLMRYVDDYERATKYINFVLEKDPDNFEPLIMKARLLTYTAKFPDAFDLFNKVLAKRSTYSNKRYISFVDMSANNIKNWAEHLIDEKNYPEAEKLLLKAKNIIFDLRKEKIADHKILTKLNEIYSQLLKCILVTKNDEIFEEILDDFIGSTKGFYKNNSQSFHTIKGIEKYCMTFSFVERINNKIARFKDIYER